MSAPEQTPCAARQISTARITWALCLLACGGIAINALLTHGSHREWWNILQSEQLHYAQWETSAQREADALVGEVEGLTREQVIERLTSRLGRDDPYPELPPSTNGALAAVAMPLPADPKVEPAVCWNVRAKNWYVIVPVYDGRAEQLTVTTLQRTFVGARAPQAEVPTFYNVVGVTCLIMYLAAIAAVAAWWFRWHHRAALHVCLAAAVVGWAALLTTDWEFGTGLQWAPPALGGSLKRAPWEGPAIGLALGLISLRVRSRRLKTGVCAKCSYDLTGNVSGVCPECGTTLAPAPPAASAALAAPR